MDTPQVTVESTSRPSSTRGPTTSTPGSAPRTTEASGPWASRRPTGDLLRGVPMSRDDTGAHQLRRLADAGLSVRMLPELVDVDTIDDARLVAATAPGSRFAAALRLAEATATTTTNGVARTTDPVTKGSPRDHCPRPTRHLRFRRRGAVRARPASRGDSCNVVRATGGAARPASPPAAGDADEAFDVARWSADADAADLTTLDDETGPVLDIGCGPARMVRAAVDRGLTALGMDVSPTAVAMALEAGLPVGRRFGLRPAAPRGPVEPRPAARRQHRHRRRPDGAADPLRRDPHGDRLGRRRDRPRRRRRRQLRGPRRRRPGSRQRDLPLGRGRPRGPAPPRQAVAACESLTSLRRSTDAPSAACAPG